MSSTLPALRTRRGVRDALMIAIVALYVLGCLWLVFLFPVRRGIPERSALRHAEGELARVRESENRYGTTITFSLGADSTATFTIPRTVAHHATSLARSRGQPAVVGYDDARVVWELDVGGRRVLTYATSSAAKERDNGFARWLGALGLLFPILSVYGKAWLARVRGTRAATAPRPGNPRRRKRLP